MHSKLHMIVELLSSSWILALNTNGLIGELNANSLSGLGLASPIPYNNVDILTIILGSGADILNDQWDECRHEGDRGPRR